jgi:hypothetical protein
MNEEMRLIPTPLLTNVINYLTTQPYGQVYQLITALTKLQPPMPTVPKPPKEIPKAS